MVELNPELLAVLKRVEERSKETRAAALAKVDHQLKLREGKTARQFLADKPSSLVHAFTAGWKICCNKVSELLFGNFLNIAIINSGNDVISSGAPLLKFPDILKRVLLDIGAKGQVAAGTPAECDGVTQNTTGMQTSMKSRDDIANATIDGLVHKTFDGALLLGNCDKIGPGLLIGALQFSIPAMVISSGPMKSGISHKEKMARRDANKQLVAEGKGIDVVATTETEFKSYPAEDEGGTCGFLGTANSNEVAITCMGLHVPGTTFVQSGTPLRLAVTEEAARMIAAKDDPKDTKSKVAPLTKIIDERAILNAVIGVLAVGGSTNLAIHMIAIANSAGIDLRLEDIDAISNVIPRCVHVFPNNANANVNDFEDAGGMPFLMRELANAGLFFTDVTTVAGEGMDRYFQQAYLDDSGKLQWRDAPAESSNLDVLRPPSNPFDSHGGFRLQGAAANGIPELHALSDGLKVLQKEFNFKVALITDGRLSGASGSIPAAIHCEPEAAHGIGMLSRVKDGDIICLNSDDGTITMPGLNEMEFNQRPAAIEPTVSKDEEHTVEAWQEAANEATRRMPPPSAGCLTVRPKFVQAIARNRGDLALAA
ncbi:MAG: phosphogluconate dehydratase [Alphaproteobacteria bacterium]|nr:phosphogluconate dehydratase [Alphaproteobacteria bacterium]